ncbi:hypothetical protein ACHAWF_001259 [Thalassiosira exigua]
MMLSNMSALPSTPKRSEKRRPPTRACGFQVNGRHERVKITERLVLALVPSSRPLPKRKK